MLLKEYKKIEEKMYVEKLKNGLTVKIVPKKHAKKKHVYLCVNYGAKNTDFYINEKRINTPYGTAHFLEHLMFQMENKVDAMEVFSKQGASANAYTCYDNTVYYFSTVSNLEKNLNLLLNLTQSLDCSENDVEEERGIITEEIKMDLDSPEDNLITGIANNLFNETYINNEIAGTIESIKMIDISILKQVFNAFYRPDNMELIIVGNVEKEKVLELINKNQLGKSFSNQNISKVEEKKDYISFPYKEKDSKIMEIVTPKVAIALKIKPDFAKAVDEFIFKKVYRIIFSHYFSATSDNWQEMLDLELVSKDFDFSIYTHDNYNFIIFETSSNKPLDFISYLYNKINGINIEGIDEESFFVYKRVIVGTEIRGLGSIANISSSLAENCFKEIDYFENLEKLEKIDLEIIKSAIKSIDKNTLTNFIIYPKI
ncbi:MAG: pitrilysin family protein [Bacilli bacterium]|nr:pitrilysin family protein [Bacilli bacterium]